MNWALDVLDPAADAESAGAESSLRTSIPWKSAWAIADNAVFALTNFLVALAVARQASVEEYGTFALAQSIALFLYIFHSAFITEPVLVFGSGRYRERVEEYVAAAVVLHIVIFVAIDAALAVAILVLASMGFSLWARAFLMAAVGSPFILLGWFLRKACYIKKSPEIACLAGLIYIAAIVPTIWLLARTGRLNGLSAFGVMGAAAIPPSLWILARIGTRCRWPGSLLRDMLRQHLRYGRWAVGTGAMRWIPFNVPLIALAITGSACYSAALRALMTLLMPAVQLFQAVNALLIPFCAGRRRPKVAQLVTAVGASESLVAIAYSVALGWGSYTVLHLLYAGKYDAYAPYLAPLSLLLAGDAVGGVVSSALQAMELPEKVFGPYFAGALLTAFVIIALHPLQLKGAVWLIVAVYALTAAFLTVVFRRVLSESRIACLGTGEEPCP